MDVLYTTNKHVGLANCTFKQIYNESIHNLHILTFLRAKKSGINFIFTFFYGKLVVFFIEQNIITSKFFFHLAIS